VVAMLSEIYPLADYSEICVVTGTFISINLVYNIKRLIFLSKIAIA
jgi:hypothetical protein